MSILELAVAAVKSRGVWPLVAWLALCGATVLAYELFSDIPLAESSAALKGMAFANAVVVLVIWRVAAWRKAHRDGQPASTTSPGSEANGKS